MNSKKREKICSVTGTTMTAISTVMTNFSARAISALSLRKGSSIVGSGRPADPGCVARRIDALSDRVDLVEYRGRVDLFGVGLLDRLRQLEQFCTLGERPGLELAFLFQLGEKLRI